MYHQGRFSNAMNKVLQRNVFEQVKNESYHVISLRNIRMYTTKKIPLIDLTNRT